MMQSSVSTTGGSIRHAAPTLSGETELMTLLLRDVGRTPRLAAQEERALAYRVQAGDQAARSRFILANLGLVVFVAKGYAGRRLSLPDVIQEGTFGLLHAAQRYDPERGVRFATYAHFWIRQAIGCALQEQTRLIRLPRSASGLLAQRERVALRLEQRLGRPPTQAEISQVAGVGPCWLGQVQAISEAMLSLEYAEHEGDPAEAFIASALLDQATPSPEEAYCQQESRRERQTHLQQALACLTGRERAALVLTYGLDGSGEQRSLAQVGRMLGLSRERVRQLHEQALAKLRRSPLSAQLWADLHPEAEASERKESCAS
jgi:RNA polymerase primary sigma factor